MNASLDLLEIAREWRRRLGYEDHGGFVVIFEREACGWVSDVQRPAMAWRPGCVAISPTGEIYDARGGNYQDGAIAWVPRKAVAP